MHSSIYYDEELNKDLQNMSLENLTLYWYMKAQHHKKDKQILLELIKKHTIGGKQ